MKIDLSGKPAVEEVAVPDGTKAGARNSAQDASRLQQIHDLAVANGATCGEATNPSESEARQTISVYLEQVPSDNPARSMGGGMKSVAEFTLRGPAVLFGDANHTDISPYRDYFTPETDFWLSSYKSRPMIFDHGVIDLDMVDAFEAAAKSSEERDAVKEFRAAMLELDRDPRIGEWTDVSIDPLALWVQGEMDKARKYATYVKQMAESGILRLSSDTALHLIKREKQLNGANKIVRWPLIGISHTTHAAEPRLTPVAAVKSFFTYLGIKPTDEFVEAVTKGVGQTHSVDAVRLARGRLEVQRLKQLL